MREEMCPQPGLSNPGSSPSDHSLRGYRIYPHTQNNTGKGIPPQRDLLQNPPGTLLHSSSYPPAMKSVVTVC